MISSLKIKQPFGLNKNNTIAHIADVESGEKCNCICIECKSPLIAVKGRIKEHHFRHKNVTECEGGLESAIHLAAKKEIMKRKHITLPQCVSTASAIDSRGIKHTECKTIVKDKQIILFDDVQEEKVLHEMKADILASKGDTQLIIEIFYRHKVDEEKIKKIKKANISAIEINLSDLTQEDVKSMETFWSRINNPICVQWLHNVKAHNSVSKLVNQLGAKIKKLETEYAQEKIRKQKKEEKEKNHLLLALEDLKVLRSKQHALQLNQEAEMHPAWKLHSQYLQLSFNTLPSFLNLEVPDGDWIFNCDRRVWQTAFYSSFIQRNGKPFCIRRVDEWLNNKAKCEVPFTAQTVGIYGRRYPELVPSDVSINLPSAWRTLQSYFKHLCDLGMLKFSPNEGGWGKDSWFRIISNTPSGSVQIAIEKNWLKKREAYQ
ncbi:MAG: competence protein CoiA family protein [Legionella sp.]|uniref:competence protein CoiA family protein n=1 Tax=Legionella sp. TaxID=459 RepID=UPI0039E6C568